MAVDALQARFPDCYVVFVGDFNDTPDCRSLQILETGGHDAQPQL